jgi:hypothetical protein
MDFIRKHSRLYRSLPDGGGDITVRELCPPGMPMPAFQDGLETLRRVWLQKKPNYFRVLVEEKEHPYEALDGADLAALEEIVRYLLLPDRLLDRLAARPPEIDIHSMKAWCQLDDKAGMAWCLRECSDDRRCCTGKPCVHWY